MLIMMVTPGLTNVVKNVSKAAALRVGILYQEWVCCVRGGNGYAVLKVGNRLGSGGG